MPSKSLEAYQAVEQSTLTGRELEAMLLAKAAARLRAAQDGLQTAQDLEQLDEALRYNQRLWTVLQTELLDANNPLPADLKQNLLALIGFIDQRTFALMADPRPERLDILIRINLEIAAGLQNRPVEAATP